MSTFVMPHEIINSTPTALKPVDATQFSGTGSNFQKIVDEWTGGTNTDLFVAKLKGTAINTDMGSPNTIGEAGQTTFNGILGAISGLPTSSGDMLALLEQRVNNAQAGAGSNGTNDGVLAAHAFQPWKLLISGTITAGASTCTLVNTGNLINIEPKNSYLIQDADATASGKQEIIKIDSVTYGSGTIAITLSGTFANSYAASAYVSGCGGSVADMSLQPKISAVSTHAAYTKNIDIRQEMVAPVTNGVVDISWRVAEKCFFVSGFTDNITIQVSSISGDAALMPQYYEGTTPFKVALIKVSKDGDKLRAIDSAALSNKNFMVFDLAAASTGTTTTTINLSSVNPVYGNSEAAESFNNNGTTTLKWVVLPLTVLKEVSAVDQAAFESWLAVTIEKIIFNGNGQVYYNDFNTADTLAGILPDFTVRTLENYGSYHSSWHIVSNRAKCHLNREGGITSMAYREYSTGFFNNKRIKFDIQCGYTSSGGYGFSGGVALFSSLNATVLTPVSRLRGVKNALCVGLGCNYSSTNVGLIYLQVIENDTLLDNIQLSTDGDQIEYTIKVELTGTTLKVRAWDKTAAEPTTWNITRTLSLSWIGASNKYFELYAGGDADQSFSNATWIDNLSIVDIQNIIIRAKALITGLANKLSVKTVTWSKSRAASVPVEYGSQAVYL